VHQVGHGSELSDAARLQHDLMGFIRAFGLLANDRTPCGQPLPPSDAHALTEIAAGVLTQRELVDRLHLDRSSVSRLVDRLVGRGWVERVDGAADRRTVTLAATAAGQRVAADIARSRADRFATLIDAVPADRRDEVLDAIQVLTRAARTRGGTG
jgi:DNA-binding MarR family transcriptional regulator